MRFVYIRDFHDTTPVRLELDGYEVYMERREAVELLRSLTKACADAGLLQHPTDAFRAVGLGKPDREPAAPPAPPRSAPPRQYFRARSYRQSGVVGDLFGDDGGAYDEGYFADVGDR